MTPHKTLIAAATGVALLAGAALAAFAQNTPKPATAGRPALTVTVTTPTQANWPQTLAANGNIAAWQEAVIGSELSGLRIAEVLVNVGDTVKRKQLLARIASDAVTADLAQAQAAVAEAEAALAESQANAERSRKLLAQGFISPQATISATTGEQAGHARLAAARARVQAEQVRLAHTLVVAPDDGVIASRSATVGSLTQPGLELFRLIRGARLEWRAEVTAAELARIKPGMTAAVTLASGARIEGKVRTVAPTVDPATRNGIVYVDLPAGSGARAGSFARGEFELGRANALALPQSAVLLRDGFAYVFLVGADNKVTQAKIGIGRRSGEQIEVTSGLAPAARVVGAGGAFLADGDLVRVVDAAPKAGGAP